MRKITSALVKPLEYIPLQLTTELLVQAGLFVAGSAIAAALLLVLA